MSDLSEFHTHEQSRKTRIECIPDIGDAQSWHVLRSTPKALVGGMANVQTSARVDAIDGAVVVACKYIPDPMEFIQLEEGSKNEHHVRY